MADSDITKQYAVTDYAGTGRHVTGVCTGTFPGPADYDQTGGGNTIDWTDLGLTAADISTAFAICLGTSSSAPTVPTHTAAYQTASDKWIYFVNATGAEVADAADLSSKRAI